MTAVEMTLLLGKYATLRVEQLKVGVEILDVREAFGRIDCLVRPFPSGAGEQWVSRDRLKVDFN